MTGQSPPYKLILVLQDLEFGGTQRYTVNLLQHLNRGLFSPELWVLRGGMDMVQLVERTGVRVKWLSRADSVSPFALFRLFLGLARHRPAVLYSLTVVPNIWARIFGRLLGLPVVISSCRSMQAKQWERILWPLSSHIICNAGSIKKKLISCHKVRPERISVVKNGVDTGYFRPSAEKKSPRPLLLFSGRLESVKDPLTALRSFQLVLREIPGARMVVTGNGRLAPQLEQFIREQSLTDHITLLPGTADVRSFLQESWVLLLSSRNEGSPNILIEAMACGVAVVASSVGGVPEIIRHGENGFLVSPGELDAFARTACMLLKDGNLRTVIGEKARESVVASHDVKDCVRLTESIIEGRIHPGNGI